ncbi:MAG: hypothetical protein KDA84_27100, partial [Planctomycetaceae bacterium]|nr:hypothetical protein [Planctomycetaceae bacterium]
MIDFETSPVLEFGPFAEGIRLSGSPDEMGRTLGQLLVGSPGWQQLISPITAYWTHRFPRLDSFLGEFGLECQKGVNATGLEPRAFAALQLEHVFSVQTRSHFAFRSEEGQLVHGVGLEGRSQPQLQWYHPKKGARCLLLAEPGQLGGLHGMNEHGLTVSVAFLQNPMRQIGEGLLPSLLVLKILSSATCLADVLYRLRMTKPGCPLGVLTTSVAEDRISYTEWDGQTLATMSRPPWVIAGNEQLMRRDALGRPPQSMKFIERLKPCRTNRDAIPNPQQIWESLNTSSQSTHPTTLWEPGVPRLRHSLLKEFHTREICSNWGDDGRPTQPAIRKPIRVCQSSESPLLEPVSTQQQREGTRIQAAF